MSATYNKIGIENIKAPGKTERVDRAKYEAMRGALLTVLTDEEPGSTVAEAKSALLTQLPEALYPEGKTVRHSERSLNFPYDLLCVVRVLMRWDGEKNRNRAVVSNAASRSD